MTDISQIMADEDEVIAREQAALRAGIEKARRIVAAVGTRTVRRGRVYHRRGDEVQTDILAALDALLAGD